MSNAKLKAVAREMESIAKEKLDRAIDDLSTARKKYQDFKCSLPGLYRKQLEKLCEEDRLICKESMAKTGKPSGLGKDVIMKEMADYQNKLDNLKDHEDYQFEISKAEKYVLKMKSAYNETRDRVGLMMQGHDIGQEQTEQVESK